MDSLRIPSRAHIVVAANANGDFYLEAPGDGKWHVREVAVLPHTASAADPTNYVTVTIYAADGTTSLGSMTTASTGLTAGTAREFSFTAGVSREYDGDDFGGIMKIGVAKSGTGVAVHAQAIARWERIPHA